MRTSRMVGLKIMLGLFPWVLATGQVHAASTDARTRAAQRACLTGNPSKGVEMLADLYLDTGDPTYIFNQGRCFEMNRQYEDAIGRFREFMVKAKSLSEEEKADAEKHIAACQSYLDSARPKASVQAEPPVKAPPVEVKPPAPTRVTPVEVAPGSSEAPGSSTGPGEAPVATVQTDAALLQKKASPANPGSALRIAGLATAAVGVAALATGVFANLKFNSMSSSLEQPYNYDRGADSTRKNYKTLSQVGYVVGTTALVGGALVYYLGWRRGRPTAVSVEALAGPGLAGVSLAGSFQ